MPMVRAPYTCTTASRVSAGSGARRRGRSAAAAGSAASARVAKAKRRVKLMSRILWAACDASDVRRAAHRRPLDARSLQTREIEQLAVEQVRGPHLAQRPHDRLDAPG